MMNYYDALLQHRHQLADAERRHEQQRHLRDSQRPQDEDTDTEKTDRPSPLIRIVIDLKSSLGIGRATRPQSVVCLKEAL